MRRQRVRGVDPAEREGRGGHGHLLGGAGVGVGRGGRGGLEAGRVGREGQRLVRGVQVRHGGQRARALPVAGHLDPRQHAQQAEPRAARHHVRARARRERPRPRTLPPVGGARLSSHNVTQNHLSRTKQGSRTRATPGLDSHGRHRMVRGFRPDLDPKLHFDNKHKVRREIVNSLACAFLQNFDSSGN